MEVGVNQTAPLEGEVPAGQRGVNEVPNSQSQSAPSPLTPLPQGEGNSLNPENQPAQNNLPTQNLPLQNLFPQPNVDVILGLINLISQVYQTEGKNSSQLEELINSMEKLLEVK